ncbi:MAG: MarR family transcriptional regulator [Bacillus sp. (in: firmicutes)]
MTNLCSLKLQIFYQLHVLNKELNTKFETCLGASPSRIEMLQQLYHVEEISQTDLQKMVKIDHAAVTRHLKQLEATEMISRRKKAEDNRVTLVCLTKHGRNVIEASLKEKEQFIRQTLNEFSEQEMQLLLKMLSKIGDNVSKVKI